MVFTSLYETMPGACLSPSRDVSPERLGKMLRTGQERFRAGSVDAEVTSRAQNGLSSQLLSAFAGRFMLKSDRMACGCLGHR